MSNTYQLYNVTTGQYAYFDKTGLHPAQALRYTAMNDTLKNAYLTSIKEGSIAELDFIRENPVDVHVGAFNLICGDWTFSLEDCFS